MLTASVFTILCLQFCQAQYGFLSVSDAENTRSLKVCATYNINFKNVNQDVSYNYQDLYPDYGCANSSHSQNFHNQFVVIQRGNCTFAEKALNFQRRNASGVIIVSNTSLVIPSATSQEYNSTNVHVTLISEESYKKITSFSENLTSPVVRLHGQEKLPYDWSTATLLMIAVVVLAIGSWWHKKSFESRMAKRKKHKPKKSNDQDLDIKVKHTVFYVVISSVFMLLLYNFYYYLVYVTQVVFVIGSGTSLFSVLKAVARKLLKMAGHQPELSISKDHVSILSVFLLVISFSVSITWMVFRHSWFSWILMDILGAAFCTFGIRSIALPNLTISSSLLSLFFLYDIFYVFITPYITPSGQSVMVSVATGDASGSTERRPTERLPALFELPKFNVPECYELSNSLLGFGDVLLPGLFWFLFQEHHLEKQGCQKTWKPGKTWILKV